MRFAYGRGSSSCLMVEMRPGHYADVYMGNDKLHEGKELTRTLMVDRDDLYRLGEFFFALWRDHAGGMNKGGRSVLPDDPHDSWPNDSGLEFSDRTIEP